MAAAKQNKKVKKNAVAVKADAMKGKASKNKDKNNKVRAASTRNGHAC
jgi:hypothetical protein